MFTLRNSTQITKELRTIAFDSALIEIETQICTSLTFNFYKVDQKVRPQTHGHNSVKSYRIFSFFTERFFGKFTVKPIFKIPSHLAYVATLPCETLLSGYKRLKITR